MVMPGVTMRKRSLKRRSCGLACLLRACQAMSMAMTTVLPDPVAILKAVRGRPSLRSAFSARMTLRAFRVAHALGRLGQVDGRLRGLDLAEEEAPLTVVRAPVFEEVAGDGGDVRVALEPPTTDGLADLVDDLVGLLARGAAELVHRHLRRALLRAGDRDEELRGAPPFRDLAADLAVRGRDEVAPGLRERRVDDGVLDAGLSHAVASGARVGRPASDATARATAHLRAPGNRPT
jgi:hypothetical protein